MASQGYRDWVAAGKPFTLAAPEKTLRDILRGHGYTVYDIGNTAHQLAVPPEDHMPYSETGWPRTSPRWFGFALDIMPPDDDDLPTLPQLLGQIYRDKMAGHPGLAWLKYMNWEPEGPGGPCYHDSWQPGHARRSSGDRGHGHLSGRSDHYLTDTTGGYDPVARWRTEGDDVSLTNEQAKALEWYAQFGDARLEAEAVGSSTILRGPNKGGAHWGVVTMKGIVAQQAAILAAVNGVAAGVAGVKAAIAALADDDELSAEDIETLADLLATKLPGDLAAQLADRLTLRFAPTPSN